MIGQMEEATSQNMDTGNVLKPLFRVHASYNHIWTQTARHKLDKFHENLSTEKTFEWQSWKPSKDGDNLGHAESLNRL
jgi:hypothetical protein